MTTLLALAPALGAFALGMFVSSITISWFQTRNRAVEFDANEKMDAPSENHMRWHLVHIRDDIGSLCGLIGVTNGLLTAILFTLVTR